MQGKTCRYSARLFGINYPSEEKQKKKRASFFWAVGPVIRLELINAYVNSDSGCRHRRPRTEHLLP